ncbi:Kir protein [Plasmodium coatneyi]|uniref:Kir protein n=1 Tax=Plasmodium coatneyi TaxID=208452 RepID=A0A1B1E5Q8_9APIC|nr:Kir protein [Plasmodium coatneyi]ANQ10089.1 Kir protein [Plasmodium coatneyi]
MSETEPAETYLKNEHLQELPSKTAYNAFENGDNECTTYGITVDGEAAQLKGVLKTHQKIKEEAEKIVKAWCSASSQGRIGTTSIPYSRLCHALYYWLGDKVWNKGNNVWSVTRFLSVMGDIYTALEQFGVENNCTLFYKDNSNIDQTIFGHRRTVFDFTFDYKNIKDLLKSHNNYCDNAYYQHLNQAKTAFEKVLNDCKSKWDDDLYCTEFRDTYETNKNSQNPLSLTYVSKGPLNSDTVYKDVQLELKYASPKSNTAMTATISSIFSIGALGFATSLLYKYNLLPSWFRNHSGGGGSNSSRTNRKKRTNGHDFDTLTSMDTSTTSYSTENSSTKIGISNTYIKILIKNGENRINIIYLCKEPIEYHINNNNNPCLTQLPSEKEYKKFEEGQTCPAEAHGQCSNEQIIEQVKGTVAIYTSVGSDTEKIVKNYYYACTKETNPTNYYSPCYFFYYWLGEKIKDKIYGRSPLGQVIGAIYKKLHQFGLPYNNKKCKDLYPGIDVSIFTPRKKIFDYSYNYKTLLGKPQSNEFLCTEICDQYLSDVQSVYSTESNSCGETTSDLFCNELKNEYKKYFDKNKKPTLPCATKPEDEEDDDNDSCPTEVMGSPDAIPAKGTELTREHLNKLPSKMLYQKFDNGDGKEGCDVGEREVNDVKTKLTKALSGKVFEDSEVNKIFHAWCYVTRTIKKKCGSLYKDPFKFLYLWLGLKLFEEKDQIDSFDDLMDDIQEGLTKMEGGSGNKCGPLCKGNIDKTIFNKRKLAYEYYMDHDGIKGQLQNPNPEKTPCDQKYYDHLKEGYTAYNEICGKCTRGTPTNPCCTEFQDMCKDYRSKKLEELKCNPISTPGAREEQHDATSPGGSIVPATAISSVTALIGLPTTAFFLYKYTSLPSLISNTLSSGGRSNNSNRKRRTTERPFNRFLDDSTTEYTATDESTIGSIAESTTTNGSTLYNDGQRRRGGRNRSNTRPRNITYHPT